MSNLTLRQIGDKAWVQQQATKVHNLAAVTVFLRCERCIPMNLKFGMEQSDIIQTVYHVFIPVRQFTGGRG